MTSGASRAATASPAKYAVATRALSLIPHPVVILAAAHAGERSCATTTCMYCSLDPAMVATTAQPASRTHRLIVASGEFSVSVLHTAQQAIAVAAGQSSSVVQPSGQSSPGQPSGQSSPTADKFAALRIPVLEPPPGSHAPAVEGSIAVLWCRVRERREVGDHVLFIGEVVADRGDPTKVDALLRYRRRYLNVGHWTSDVAPEGYPT